MKETVRKGTCALRLILALALCLGMMPRIAFAAEGGYRLQAALLPAAVDESGICEIGTGTVSGDGSVANPIGYSYKNSFSEQIYTAEEIGSSGSIQSIAFNVKTSSAGGTGYEQETFKVYMAHVDPSVNLATSYVSPADITCVYDGKPVLGATVGAWDEIELSTPFEYNGSDNLLIAIVRTDDVYVYVNYTMSNVTPAMAAHWQKDSNPEYVADFATAIEQTTFTTSTARANLRMRMQTCAHSKGSIVETVDPTCTQMGYTVYNCVTEGGCGGTFKDDYQDPLGHDMQVTRKATCDTEGTRSCSRDCGEDGATEPIAPRGHDWDWDHAIADPSDADVLTAPCRNQATDEYEACSATKTRNVRISEWDGQVAEGFGGALGTEEDPYVIEEASQLAFLAQQVNGSTAEHFAGKHFELAVDIDLQDLPWTPIGYNKSSTVSYSFGGIFDGGGHSISGLNFSKEDSNATGGLFGAVYGAKDSLAEVRNLVLYGSCRNAASTGYVGGLCGRANYARFVNIGNNAEVSADGSSYQYAGGIVAQATASSTGGCQIIGCYNKGAISASVQGTYSSAYAGGITAYSYSTSAPAFLIQRCYNAGTIAVTGSGSGRAGGLVGYVSTSYTGSGKCSMTDSFNIGSVSCNAKAGGSFYGDLVGSCSGTTASYAVSFEAIRCHGVAGQGAMENAGIYEGCFTECDPVTADAMGAPEFLATLNERLESADRFLSGPSYPLLPWEDYGTPVITGQTESPLTVALTESGAACTLRIQAQLPAAGRKGSDGTLSFQWYRCDSAGADAQPIPGATAESCNVTFDATGRNYFRCKVTNAFEGQTAEAYGSVIYVNVTDAIPAAMPTVTIDAQKAETVEQGAPFSLSGTVTFDGNPQGIDDPICLEYQWSRDGVPLEGASGTCHASEIPALAIPTDEIGESEYSLTVVNIYQDTKRSAPVSTSATVTVRGKEIATAEELAAFAAEVNGGNDFSGKTVSLTADIDLGSFGEWTPIGNSSSKPFRGTFDGRNHRIDNLTISSGSYSALFGYVRGTADACACIENLVVGGSVTGTSYVAGLCAYANSGYLSFRNVGNEAKVQVAGTSSSSYCGGICASTSTTGDCVGFFECYNIGDITGYNNVGGICGRLGCGSTQAGAALMANCYNAGDIKAQTQSSANCCCGGLVGLLNNNYTYNWASIENCYSVGSVATNVDSFGGAIIGGSIGTGNSSDRSRAAIVNCHALTDPAEKIANANYVTFSDCTAKSAAEMESPEFAALLNGEEGPFDGRTDALYAGGPVFAWQMASLRSVSGARLSFEEDLTYQAEPLASKAAISLGNASLQEGCCQIQGFSDADCTIPATIMNAGAYYAKAVGMGAKGYKDSTGVVCIEVKKAPLTAAIGDGTLAFSEISNYQLPAPEVSGFLGADNADNAEGYRAPSLEAPWDGEPIPGQVYLLTPSGGQADNYEFSYESGTLKVEDAPDAESIDGMEARLPSSGDDALEYSGHDMSAMVDVELRSHDGTVLERGRDYTVLFHRQGDFADAGIPQIIAAGTYYAEVKGIGGYKGSIPLNQPIELLRKTIALPEAATGLVYNGKEQSGVRGFDDQWMEVTGQAAAVDSGAWEAQVALKDPVNMQWAGLTGEEAAAPRTIAWSVEKATLSARYAGESIPYNGTARLAVTVTGFVNGDGPATAAGYVAPFAKAPSISAGCSFTITPQGGSADNYRFTYVSGTLTVGAVPMNTNSSIAAITKATPSVTLAYTSKTYSGKVLKPAVKSVKVKGKALPKSSYTVTYSAKSPKTVGSYKVKVTLKGAWSGLKTVSYRIIPKATSLAKVTAARKAFTVKWKKASKAAAKQISGYQVRYSTAKSMKGAKTKTVKGASKTSAKVTKMKSGKKYYVQVRTYKTVGKTKYVSAWSKAKTVKVK